MPLIIIFYISIIFFSDGESESSDANISDGDDQNFPSKQDENALFKNLADLMPHAGSVARCIKLYGAKNSQDKDMPKMIKITELADQLISMGHYSVYEYDQNKLMSLIKANYKESNEELSSIFKSFFFRFLMLSARFCNSTIILPRPVINIHMIPHVSTNIKNCGEFCRNSRISMNF